MRLPNENAPRPFDRALWRARRGRAATTLETADFLLDETVESFAERLAAVTRRFGRAAVIGAGTGKAAAMLGERFGIGTVLQLDASPAMATRARRGAPDAPVLVADEEALPLAPASLDLIVAPLTLHWTNDLPGTLIQMRRALRPDGLFMAALFAGETLRELRACLAEAEIETAGGLSPRIAPMADLRDLGGLLQRAGLALPVADTDTHVVRYGSFADLVADLRRMGATYANPHPGRRATFARAAALYAERFSDPDGRLRATFEHVSLSGWAPHPSQQKPLRPGSAKARLAEALGTTETKA